MTTVVPAHLPKNDLHGRTAKLAEEAGQAGDEFLKYLYVIALRHIEETTIDNAEMRVVARLVV